MKQDLITMGLFVVTLTILLILLILCQSTIQRMFLSAIAFGLCGVLWYKLDQITDRLRSKKED